MSIQKICDQQGICLYLCLRLRLISFSMNPYKILIIDDNQSVLRTLKLVLNGVFKTVVTTPNPKVIPIHLQADDIDVILLDMNFDARKLDGEEGLYWLNRINESPNAPAVVLITAFGDIDLAVKCVQQGAEDFITKPWDNQVLIQKLECAIEKHRAKQRTASLAAQAAELHDKIEADQLLSLEDMERKHILEVVNQENGNLVKAAERLDISRQTLYNKLKKFGTIV